MVWTTELSGMARKQLKKLDKTAQKAIITYLETRIAASPDPYRLGKSLQGDLKGLWRYRVGDYRLICHIKNEQLTVLVLAVGHRKQVYKRS